MNKVGGGGGRFIKQYFRRNYRRKLIAVGGIKFRRYFRRKLIEMRTKKVRKSRQTFRSVGKSVGNAVGKGTDGHVSDMRDPLVTVQTDTCQTCVIRR
jgi:hypothetical protein